MSFSADEPFRVNRRDTLLGAWMAVIITLSLVAYTYWDNRLQQQQWISFYAELDQTYSITRDTPIKLSGVVIGKVKSVTLMPDASIQLAVQLSREQKDFYTQTSRLTLGSDFGLSNVISGGSINLLPGKKAELLQEGSEIVFEPPGSITDWVDKLGLVETTKTFNEILVSVNALLQSLKERQDAIDEILDNTALASASINENSINLNAVLVESQMAVTNINSILTANEQNIQLTISNLNQLIERSQTTLENANTLMISMENATDGIPSVLLSTQSTLSELEVLTMQLQHHWLLGGANKPSSEQPALLPSYPADWSIYETNSTVTDNTKH